MSDFESAQPQVVVGFAPPPAPSVAVADGEDDAIGAPCEPAQPQVAGGFAPPAAVADGADFGPDLPPPWEARKGSTWVAVPGRHYWHAKHGFAAVGAKRGKYVGCNRACGECGKQTRGPKEPLCGKCGGERQVCLPCANEGCNRLSNHAGADGTRVCGVCWIEEDVAKNGCPRCQKAPKSTRADNLCGNCVKGGNTQAKRDAQQPALATFRALDTRLQLLAKGEEGVPGTYYAGLNREDDYKPFAFSFSSCGGRPSCCTAPEGGALCLQVAVPNETFGRTRCIRHGGGPRCEASGVHALDDLKPHAKYTFSEAVSTRIGGTTHPKPEWVGKPACMLCLKRLDPTNIGVKVQIDREELVMAGIAEECCSRGRADLVSKEDGMVHDCATGTSRRRADLRLLPNCGRLVLLMENDEGQHKDRSTSCEHAKLAGHLVDAGLPGYTKTEDALWDDALPSDAALEALEETADDTPTMARLRANRKAATARVLKSVNRATKHRSCDASTAHEIKLLCVRFNCDGFVAADGTKIGGLFTDSDVTDDSQALTRKPTELFAPAIRRLVDRLVAIEALEKDDDWFNSLKTWNVEYLRYDGCARDGSDPDGAVAKAHAARKVGDTDAAVEAEQAKKKEIGKARRARKREAEAEAEAEAINR